MTENKKIKVMIVEDSSYMRYVISEILNSDPDIEVIEKARDGIDALERLAHCIPDVITLDIQMPRMDGLTFLEELKKTHRIPTIMISSLTSEGAVDTLRALELGAIDFVPKPSNILSYSVDEIKEMMIEKVKIAATIKAEILTEDQSQSHITTDQEQSAAPPLETLAAAETLEKLSGNFAQDAKQKESAPETAIFHNRTASRLFDRKKKMDAAALEERAVSLQLKKIVVIGSSTGGPRALTEIIPLFPADLNACVIVVQHMPAKFTTSLAERLDKISEIEVREAKNGDKVRPGIVYIAPGDFHIYVGKSDTIYLGQEPPSHGVRPSVDFLMKSVAKIYGNKSIGVILTGMGVDGKDGVILMKDAGATIVAEHETTCVVYGMPKAAISTGKVDTVLTLPYIADEILQLVES